MPYQQTADRSAEFHAQTGNTPSGMGLDFNGTQELKTSVEGWERCLRSQITSHPRIALGMGLMAGLIAGWWIKR